jgi:phosphorylase kinase alpha/beta subunit
MELRMSSVAACVAGLKGIASYVSVPQQLIDAGMKTLHELFPNETKTRAQDLAQLTAIYPYRVFDDEKSEVIVRGVEANLVRELGFIRYQDDSYYSTLEKNNGRGMSAGSYIGSEAQWTFGFGYLSLAWRTLGNTEKAKEYLARFEGVALPDGAFPELYLADGTPNLNTPLLWAHAVYINANI